MANLRSLAGAALTTVLTSPWTRDVRRSVAEWKRRLSGAPHRVLYFHQTDDPYSHLAAQVLEQFRDAYDVELVPHLVGPPPDDAAPERERLIAHSRKDAADIAPYYELSFRDRGRQPSSGLVGLANRILAGAIEDGTFVTTAPQVGEALWAEDPNGLERLARDPQPGEDVVRQRILDGDALRERLGHYLGAMFYDEPEWYWGVDRLHHLERRLTSLGLRRGGNGRIVPPREAGTGVTSGPGTELRAPDRRLRLEFFPSLRSPYTYVAMERVFALPRRYPVDLVLRPVLPMVMRGLPVPRAKRLYILLDTKREAEDAGVPFGTIADPVGRPVERGLSLFPWARAQGKAEDLFLSFGRAVWSEGIDAASDDGLRRIVERAGLSWGEARQTVDNDDWRPEIERNREAMFEMGLWGVPSFRLSGGAGDGDPPFVTWGQDRIWLIEEEIRKRLRR